jgi:phenylalanyl-tRNA synthetase alpha subunit
MPWKRSRRDHLSQQHGAAKDRREALRDILHIAVNAGEEEAFQQLEQERTKAEEESARLLNEAREKAAKVKEDAERYITKMRRKLQEDRAALEEENAEIKRRLQEDRTVLEEEVTSMEKAHTFQSSKILLNVGGHRFETSLQSLTSVPHTYFASLFSGRFELASDAKGAYFIDRDGKNFHYILNFLRDSGSFKLSSNMM